MIIINYIGLRETALFALAQPGMIEREDGIYYTISDFIKVMDTILESNVRFYCNGRNLDNLVIIHR